MPFDSEITMPDNPFIDNVHIWAHMPPELLRQTIALLTPIHPALAAQLQSSLDDHYNPKYRQYVQMAYDQHTDYGTVEVDDAACVSWGADDGAYVMAWVWVDDPEVDDTDPAEQFLGVDAPNPYTHQIDPDSLDL